MSPGNQFSAAIIPMKVAVNKRRAISVCHCPFETLRKFLRCMGFEAKRMPFSFLSAKCLDQAGIVPVLNTIVEPIVDLYLDRVALIVHKEYNDWYSEAYHLGYLLSRHLKRTIAYHHDNPLMRFCKGIAERGGDGPSNVAPLHFNFKIGPKWQV
ncbi:hypothetical protein HG530_011882 [Fusarium avenaceum]|nr:hypothetical protein HG530_011882 [Fusarium avenaceum]